MTLSDLTTDLDALLKDGLITEVVGELKSGKEATVFLVRRRGELLALKHYRALHGRGFTQEAKYREGRFMKARDARAFRKRTRYGRHIAQQSWIAQEYRMLRRLHRHGTPIPRPVAMCGASILMEFIATRPGSLRPAPRLIDLELTDREARRFHGVLMQAIITMAQQNVVHADLSPYNVLVQSQDGGADGKRGGDEAGRRPVIIDFPQAVDPRFNHAAHELLTHDVAEITNYLRRFNERIDDRDLASRLWRHLVEGRL